MKSLQWTIVDPKGLILPALALFIFAFIILGILSFVLIRDKKKRELGILIPIIAWALMQIPGLLISIALQDYLMFVASLMFLIAQLILSMYFDFRYTATSKKKQDKGMGDYDIPQIPKSLPIFEELFGVENSIPGTPFRNVSGPTGFRWTTRRGRVITFNPVDNDVEISTDMEKDISWRIEQHTYIYFTNLSLGVIKEQGVEFELNRFASLLDKSKELFTTYSILIRSHEGPIFDSVIKQRIQNLNQNMDEAEVQTKFSHQSPIRMEGYQVFKQTQSETQAKREIISLKNDRKQYEQMLGQLGKGSINYIILDVIQSEELDEGFDEEYIRKIMYSWNGDIKALISSLTNYVHHQKQNIHIIDVKPPFHTNDIEKAQLEAEMTYRAITGEVIPLDILLEMGKNTIVLERDEKAFLNMISDKLATVVNNPFSSHEKKKIMGTTDTSDIGKLSVGGVHKFLSEYVWFGGEVDSRGNLLGPRYYVYIKFSPLDHARHIFFLGTTGSGKSVYLRTLIFGLYPRIVKKVFMVADGTCYSMINPIDKDKDKNPKRMNYSRILREFQILPKGIDKDKVFWLKIGSNVSFNMLKCPEEIEGILQGLIIENIINILQRMGGGRKDIFREFLRETIKKYWGKKEDCSLQKLIIEFPKYFTEAKDEQSCMRYLNTLKNYEVFLDENGLTDMHDIFKDYDFCILDMSAINNLAGNVKDEIYGHFLGTLLDFQLSYLKNHHAEETPHLLIALEEALLNLKSKEAKAIFYNMLVEIRKYGGILSGAAQGFIATLDPTQRAQTGLLMLLSGTAKNDLDEMLRVGIISQTEYKMILGKDENGNEIEGIPEHCALLCSYQKYLLPNKRNVLIKCQLPSFGIDKSDPIKEQKLIRKELAENSILKGKKNKRNCMNCLKVVSKKDSHCPNCKQLLTCGYCGKYMDSEDELTKCPLCNTPFHYHELLSHVLNELNCPACEQFLQGMDVQLIETSERNLFGTIKSELIPVQVEITSPDKVESPISTEKTSKPHHKDFISTLSNEQRERYSHLTPNRKESIMYLHNYLEDIVSIPYNRGIKQASVLRMIQEKEGKKISKRKINNWRVLADKCKEMGLSEEECYELLYKLLVKEFYTKKAAEEELLEMETARSEGNG